MENPKEIFALALGLSEPWYIKEMSFDTSESRLDIHLDFIRGHRFDTGDGNAASTHDTVKRSWEHLNFFQHRCFIHARVPRVKRADGKVRHRPFRGPAPEAALPYCSRPLPCC